jgi:ADP-ribosylglycohydrolase
MAAVILEKFKGCMLCLAIGDALGMPVEGLTAKEIRETVGQVRDMMSPAPDHFHFGLKAGQFTDDTEETLILAESMLESYGFSGDKFAEKMMDWGKSWALDESLNRGVGLATKASLAAMRSGISWQESGARIPTCGSAMRVAPIGLLYHCDLGMVSRYAELQSISTHCSSAARAASVAVAAGVALGLKDFPKSIIFNMASSLAARVDRDFSQRLQWAGNLLEMNPDEALEAIGNSPEVYETVPAAFYCYLRFSPEEAMVAAASAGGDTDSIASIAGSLIGASFGTSWLPQRWLSVLEGRENIEAVASCLAEMSALLCGEGA